MFKVQSCAIFLSLCSLLSFAVQGQQTVQDDWIAPTLPDRSTIIVVGTEYTFRWSSQLTSWFSIYADLADPTNCDLWLTSSDFGQKLASNIDVGSTTSFSWLVNVTDAQLSVSTGFAVAFRQAGIAYNTTGYQSIFSPQFTVRAAQSSGSTVSSSTTTSASSSASSAASTTAASGTTTQTSGASSATSAGSTGTGTADNQGVAAKDSSIGGGAIAGIVIGAVAVIAFIALGVWYMMRKKKNRMTATGSPAASTPLQPYEDAPAYQQTMYQAKGYPSQPPHGYGHQELDGTAHNNYPHRYEMS